MSCLLMRWGGVKIAFRLSVSFLGEGSWEQKARNDGYIVLVGKTLEVHPRIQKKRGQLESTAISCHALNREMY